MSVLFRDTLEDSLTECFRRDVVDMWQKTGFHFGKRRIEEVEPIIALGRENILETARQSGQVSRVSFGDVRVVVFQHDADHRFPRRMVIEPAQQCDEVDVSITRLDIRDDLAGVEFQRRNDRQGYAANVLVFNSDSGELAGCRQQIRAGRVQRSHSLLLVYTNGVGRHSMRRVGSSAVLVHVALDHQHFGHVLGERRVVPLQVVAHSMCLESVGVKNTPDRGLTRLEQPGKTQLGRVGRGVFGQCRDRSQLSGQPPLFGLAARQNHHPRLSELVELRGIRPVIPIVQPRHDPGGQRPIDAFVDSQPLQRERDLRRGFALCVHRQHFRTLDFTMCRGSRVGRLIRYGALLHRGRQDRSTRLFCHSRLCKRVPEPLHYGAEDLGEDFSGTKY